MDGQQQQNVGQSAEKGLDGLGLIGVDVTQAEAATSWDLGCQPAIFPRKPGEQSREKREFIKFYSPFATLLKQ